MRVAKVLAVAVMAVAALMLAGALMQAQHAVKPRMTIAGGVVANPQAPAIGAVKMSSVYTFELVRCRDGRPAGARTPRTDRRCRVMWREHVHNLVVDDGLNDLLDKYFKGSSYSATWYVGLKNTGTVAAGDTMGSHAGWTENTTYSNANRPTLTLGTVASKSVDNSASKAAFNINGSTTIFGAFVTSNNTKGGTTGILYGAADFSGSRAVQSGDTLNVTITLTAS